ncbi:ABC transporter substrate-binding protein [Roseivivax sp. GX 12232]|uniref:ABC transporter substrate-binding protein n=1 Tax=Roseivivax sp. GX 12232 TaxID=2900547 RepID=UPI001E3BBA6D|nr:ABC transporter substrate-binding protein [Roseivivax sp. GX 12232]MCE0504118.1 ABC transporter substrate-binding protein [Roseivivax sp. GX 12232]
MGVTLAALLASTGTAALAQSATGQAPMLDALVESGDLPPVAERVGTEPFVHAPVEGVRSYGGTLRQLYSGGGDEAVLWLFYGYEPLLRWNQDADGVVPNIAESYEVNEDASVFTFDLREGMRWSDGHPFTAHDIVWFFDHVQPDENIDPTNRLQFLVNQEVSARAIDDYTLEITLGQSNAMFPILLAQPHANWLANYPPHYLEQFHGGFNDDAGALAAEEGYQSWYEMFQDKLDPFQNIDKPTINAWVLTRPESDPTQVEYARNPYYWKVDDEGNQLPYIDGAVMEIVENREVMLLKAVNGEVDWIARYINTAENRPVFFENIERADLDYFEIVVARSSPIQIHMNRTAQDPIVRKVLNDRDVRIAMSHAIDREEISQLIYAGQCSPAHQTSPRPEEAAFYDEEMGTQFTEHDVARANQLLDEAGYDQRDSKGWRMTPDGEPIAMIATVRADRQPYVDMMPFLTEAWQEIGLNVEWRSVEKSAKNAFRDSNQHHILIDDGDGASMGAYIFPRAYVPLHPDSAWMTGWVHWATGVGSDPQEPPAWMKEVISLHQAMQKEPDLDRQNQLYRDILAIHKEQFNVPGICLPANNIGFHTKRLRNVPDVLHGGTVNLGFPGPAAPEQFAILEE